jgi:hypothetical protein
MTMHIAADTKLSVNKAATLWGISATTIYKALDKGQLARAGDGKLLAAEMIRVFGKLNPVDTATTDSAPAPKRKSRSANTTPTSPGSAPTLKAPRHKAAFDPATDSPPVDPVTAPDIPPQLEQQLRQQIAELSQQLVDAKNREDWLKAQINELWTEKVELQNAKKGMLGRLLG